MNFFFLIWSKYIYIYIFDQNIVLRFLEMCNIYGYIRNMIYYRDFCKLSSFESHMIIWEWRLVKGALSGLRQFLDALFVLEIFQFLIWIFGHVGRRFDKKAKINFKIYGVTKWITNNSNTILPNISRSKGNQTM